MEMRKHQRLPRGASGTTSTIRSIKMGAGNSLGTFGGTEYFGLKAIFSNTLTTVPTAVPTALDAVYTDGLSAGELNGALVWCASRLFLDTDDDEVADTVFTDKVLSIPEDVRMISYVSRQVPIAGTSPLEFATVYLPGLV